MSRSEGSQGSETRRRRSHLESIALGDTRGPATAVQAQEATPVVVPAINLGPSPSQVAAWVSNALRIGALAGAGYAIYSYAKGRRGRAAYAGAGAGAAWLASRFAVTFLLDKLSPKGTP